MVNDNHSQRRRAWDFRGETAWIYLAILALLVNFPLWLQGVFHTADGLAPMNARAPGEPASTAEIIIGLVMILASASTSLGQRRRALSAGHRSLRSRLKRYKQAHRKALLEVLALQDQLLKAQEEERRQISRDLHDSTLGYLTATGLTLTHLSLVTPMALDAGAALDQAKGLLKAAIKELRAFTYLMHPPALESAGLRATTEQFLAGFSQRTGLNLSARFQGTMERLPLDLQCCMFRVLQEALSNVHRHARASKVKVFLAETSSKIVLLISDNGQGMACETGTSPRFGVGIPGMRNRLQRMGGQLTIKRMTGGTSVRADIPLQRFVTDAA
jgi:signal transduction histidine kinase